MQDGAGELSGRIFDLCNDTDWNDYVTGGKCLYRGDCSLRRNKALYSVSPSIPYSTTIKQAIQAGGGGSVNNTLTTLLSNYTETPDFCVLGNTMFHTVQLDGSPYNTMLTMMPKRFVRVWLENKKTVTEPISISSFVGINNSAATDDSSQPWWFNFPNSDVPVQPAPQGQGGGGGRGQNNNGGVQGSDGGKSLDYAFQNIDLCKGVNITLHANIEAELLANQRLIQSREIPNTKLDCISNEKNPDMVYENTNGMEAAIAEFESMFPDYAITFDKSESSGSFAAKNLNLNLEYSIHTFAQHKESWGRYKWVRIFYGTSFDPKNTDKLCNQVKMLPFIPSEYWGFNLINHYQRRVGVRRRSTPELPYMFLTTQVLNGKLYDKEGTDQVPFQINPKITGMPLVRYPQSGINAFQLFLMLLVFPLMTMLFFPLIVQNVALEMREKLVLAIRLQSGRLAAYWGATYLFHYTLYFGGTFLFAGFQALIGNRIFVDCNVGQLIAVLAFWGHAQIGMGIFLAMILSRTRLQMLSAYVMMLLVMILTPMLWGARLSEWTAGLWIFPPTAFIRGYVFVLYISNVSDYIYIYIYVFFCILLIRLSIYI